jgi:hypothetical protein
MGGKSALLCVMLQYLRHAAMIPLAALTLFYATPACAGGAEDQQAYIALWKGEAVRQMVIHRIPASITLAQGLLESGSGKSELSKKSNNHFGIKCHKGWEGGKTYYDDDKKGECFRVYEDPKDSYEDHSLFLKRDRYASLFELKIDDYKNWARGLKRCGYATSPTYAKALIELIERHDLGQYDQEGKDWMKQGGMPEPLAEVENPRPNKGPAAIESGRTIHLGSGRSAGFSENDVAWVQGRLGESLDDLAKSLQVAVWQLRKYNDLENVDSNTLLPSDTRLYTQPKRRRGSHDWHIARAGETLRDISQSEAVKLKVLESRTGMTADQPLTEGQKVPLRFPPGDDGKLPWYANIGGGG